MLALFHVLPLLVSHGCVEEKNHRTTTMMRDSSGYRHRSHLRLRMFLGTHTSMWGHVHPEGLRAWTVGSQNAFLLKRSSFS